MALPPQTFRVLPAWWSSAAFELGHVGVELQPGFAEPLLQQGGCGAVQVYLADGSVDGLAAAQVALPDADAVALVGERRVHDADCRARTVGETSQDQIIGGDGVDPPVLQHGDACAVAGGWRQCRCDVQRLRDALPGVGASDRAQPLSLEVVHAADRGVAERTMVSWWAT